MCQCCKDPKKIYTIDELLDNAYRTIDNSPFAQRLLNFLKLSKEEITLSQNRSRTESNERSDIDAYEVIKVGKMQALIGFYFNESLTKIEGLFFKNNIFSSSPFQLFTKENASEYLNTLLKTVVERIEYKNYFMVEPCKDFEEDITLMIRNKNSFNSDFKNMRLQFKNYSFIQIMFLDNIDRDFYFQNKGCGSQYLSQEIVEMYPDFGMADFWVDGTSTDISEFQEFISENDHLVEEVEKWVGDFNFNAPDSSKISENFEFDWDAFNTQGKKLHEELQLRVKDKFIVSYWMSFQEAASRHAKLKRDKRSAE
jgi:hypothetical protein